MRRVFSCLCTVVVLYYSTYIYVVYLCNSIIITSRGLFIFYIIYILFRRDDTCNNWYSNTDMYRNRVINTFTRWWRCHGMDTFTRNTLCVRYIGIYIIIRIIKTIPPIWTNCSLCRYWDYTRRSIILLYRSRRI